MATLDSIIKQMILSAFRSANMESASPGKINHFIGMEGGMDLIGSTEEIKEAIREAVAEILNDPDSAENLSQDLLDAEEKTRKTADKKGTKERQAARLIRQGTSIADNPAILIGEGIKYLPHATLLLLAISLAPLIFDILTKPGGPLDLRFKRIIDNEINAFLSRQTKKDTEFGVRQVIIQSKIGFTAKNGANNYNTIRGIREGGIDKERLDRIGMVDHAKGVSNLG